LLELTAKIFKMELYARRRKEHVISSFRFHMTHISSCENVPDCEILKTEN